MLPSRILVSGAGIAGLTFAIELKRHGFEPVVIEREPGLRREGYMMDFFGTGWDVASRMGLAERLRAVRYPIETGEFIDAAGEAYAHFPVERLRAALDNKYVYLRRPDLERILAERAREVGVEIRYGQSLAALEDRGAAVLARFVRGGEETFALAVGADGMHSRVRDLVFGAQGHFARFLGLYVAAFHLPSRGFSIGRKLELYEEADRAVFLYPLSATQLDATLVFRHAEMTIPHDNRIGVLRDIYRDSGWIVQDVITAYTGDEPIYFDSVTQIVMPQWHKGRIALIGDACGCLTLLAGQGSHMAMAGGYVLAQELARQPNHKAAFAAYQKFLKPAVDKRQRDARRFVRIVVPTARSRPWLRRLFIRMFFSALALRYGLAFFGSRSVLAGYD
ncbi:MAG TPA: FAD-dependent monooxygenase [Pseudolabrys sp.]|nr:FAD-dependent monooxygenase [Pseudolabrys sp.]